MKVLILDNNADDRAMVAAYVRQAGYSCQESDSVVLARELVKHDPFGLVVLDWMLCDGSGAQFCAEIREEGGYNVAIIFVTNQDSPHNRLAALQLGADDIMGKPYDAEELLARIEAHVRRYTRSDQELQR